MRTPDACCCSLAFVQRCEDPLTSAACTAGAILLARSLRNWDNEGVRLLDLGYNDISDKGACQLALVRVCLHCCTGCLHELPIHSLPGVICLAGAV